MNIYDIHDIYDISEAQPTEELTTILAESDNRSGSVRIERIISTGQVSGWYDQDETEFVALLDGNAALEFEGGRRVSMARGDTLTIQPHERHKVTYTSTTPPCIWLCVFY